MPSSQTPPPDPTRLVTATGVVIALCIVGDSFLYGILPLEAKNLGIALPLVGVLLSANRLVRLISNTWASRLFERWGPSRPFAVATLLALFTTATYALGRGFAAFLPARLGWGVAWSGLRQGGYQAVRMGDARARGRLMGLLWGIIRLGSALSVVAGGYLRDRFGYQVAALAVMGATALAIPLALTVRWPTGRGEAFPDRPAMSPTRAPDAVASMTPGSRRNASPLLNGLAAALHVPRGRRLLIAGFIHAAFEGVMISTASLFLASRLGSSELLAGSEIRVATVAGLVLAVRWTSDILFGPAVGAISDRLGHPPAVALLAALLLAGVIGVTQLTGLALVVCLSLVFVSSAGLNVTLGAIANSTALETERPHLFVGVYTTFADAGAALGPLLAYSAGAWVGMNGLYSAGAAALSAAALLYWRGARAQKG